MEPGARLELPTGGLLSSERATPEGSLGVRESDDRKK